MRRLRIRRTAEREPDPPGRTLAGPPVTTPQNETTDTGQVDRYQREHAYDGTQMVRDARAFAYRLVHLDPKKSPAEAGLKSAIDRQGCALPPKKRTKLISVPVDGVNLRVVLLSAAYGSVPDTKIEAASSIRPSNISASPALASLAL